MAYGLRVFGPSGTLQLDQDYSNYALHSSGVGTGNGWATWTGTNYPMIFTRPNSGVGPVNTHVDAANRRFQITAGRQWAMFLPSNTVAERADTHGLRVFRQNGQIAFSSRHTPFRLFSVTYVYGSSVGYGRDLYIPLPSGGPAWLLCNWQSLWAVGAGGYYSLMHDFTSTHLRLWLRFTPIQYYDSTPINGGMVPHPVILGTIGWL